MIFNKNFNIFYKYYDRYFWSCYDIVYNCWVMSVILYKFDMCNLVLRNI